MKLSSLQFAWLATLILTCTTSQVWAGDLEDKLDKIKSYVAEYGCVVFNTHQGSLENQPRTRSWGLERDRNYRIFLVAETALEDITARLELYNKAVAAPAKREYQGMEYYEWHIMTFQVREIEIQLVSQGSNGRKYAIVIASAGRDPAFIVYWKSAADQQGHVYEILQDVVYRDGRKLFDSKYQLIHLAVTPNGNAYALTSEGYVISDDGLVYKGSTAREQAIIKIACGYDNRVFLFRQDGAVLDQRGNISYKRTGEEKIVDLLEDRWCVWYLAQNGRRIKP